jgi:hypothetical protein
MSNKTVAEHNSIPSQPTASAVASELQAGQTSEAEGTPVPSAKLDSLAKARAAKAAKAAARKAALTIPEPALYTRSASRIKSALDAELAADRHSFGEIKEVGRTIPTAEEYVKVEIPLTDLFDHSHPGVQLNRHKFEPGKTYLLRGDVALEVKRRLAMFHDEQVRLLRPNADRKALADVNRGSQWSSRAGSSVVPLGRLEDVPTASDERIYTVDF